MKKRLVSLALCFILLMSLPLGAFSANEQGEYMKIYHVDCGRKYLSAEELCALIDLLADYDYSHLQLAFGNNGLRFLPDDMSIETGNFRFESDEMCAALKEGNAAYTSHSSGELSEEEMDAVIAYAESKGVDIIPMLNSPGHMNAILYAIEKLTGEDFSFAGSSSTVDVCSAGGLELVQAILKKYVDYFASKGCRFFNMGADEYANDYFSTGSMGFGRLISEGKYGGYADYVNSAAEIIKNAGMIPMAFNDGIYFADTKTNGAREVRFDTDILICYWQKGWGEYTTRSAAELASDGFGIINTNDDWYYVLGRRGGGFGFDFAKMGAAETPYYEVSGDRDGEVKPLGSMVCLWCDDPAVDFSAQELENIRSIVMAFAINNPGVFKLEAPELVTDAHPAYISGYPDGTMRPKASITRAETAAMIYKLLTEESLNIYDCGENSFADISGTAWYSEAVSTLAAAGILAGYGDGSFRPEAPVSRAEFAAIMSRFATNMEGGSASFSDVPHGHWAAEAIALAEAMGWIGGYPDGSFRLSQSISRAEAAAILNRVLERAIDESGSLAGMNTWADNPPGTWYYWELQEAGTGHEFDRRNELVPNRDYFYEKWTKLIK